MIINAHAKIPNLIMGYANFKVANYQNVRDYICQFFNVLPHICFVGKNGLSIHAVFYISPFVDRISEAPFVVMGEMHEGGTSQAENSCAIDSLIEPNSLLLAEGATSIAKQKKPLKRDARALVLTSYQVSATAQSRMEVYGWDSYEAPVMTHYQTLSDVEDRLDQLDSENNANNQTIAPQLHSTVLKSKLTLESAQAKERREKMQLGDEWCLRSLQSRNQAMNEALAVTNVMVWRGELKGKVFLITGDFHFRGGKLLASVAGAMIPADPRTNPAAVHKKLKDLPCIVIYPFVLDATPILAMGQLEALINAVSQKKFK